MVLIPNIRSTKVILSFFPGILLQRPTSTGNLWLRVYILKTFLILLVHFLKNVRIHNFVNKFYTKYKICYYHIWAASWQNQQSECAPSEDTDPPSLIRVFVVRMKKAWTLSFPLSEDWSDWADAQADLSLRWAHSHIFGFVTRWLIFCHSLM